MIIQVLNHNTYITFLDCFDTLFKGIKREKDFEVISINSYKYFRFYTDKLFSGINIKLDIRYYIEPILKKSILLLKYHNFTNIDENSFLIEFQRRNFCYNNESKKGLNIGWHYDDFGAVPYRCYTIIYYLTKTPTLKGGDFLFENKNKETNKIIVEEKKYLIFKGDVLHSPQNTKGFGIRDAIVFFIKRI